MKQRQIENLGS